MTSALIAAIATGVVGIAGLITTWASARRQSTNELTKLREEHAHQIALAKRQDRLRIYSEFIQAQASTIRQIHVVQVTVPPGEKDYTSAMFTETQTAIMEVVLLAQQAWLISGGSEVGRLCLKLAGELQQGWSEVLQRALASDESDPEVLSSAAKTSNQVMKSMAEELK